MKKVGAILLLTVFLTSVSMTCPAMATSQPACVSVIIVFKEAVSARDIQYLTSLGGVIKYTYTIIDGVAAELPVAAANRLKCMQNDPDAAKGDPMASRIKYVEDDITMHALGNDGTSPGKPFIAGTG